MIILIKKEVKPFVLNRFDPYIDSLYTGRSDIYLINYANQSGRSFSLLINDTLITSNIGVISTYMKIKTIQLKDSLSNLSFESLLVKKDSSNIYEVYFPASFEQYGHYYGSFYNYGNLEIGTLTQRKRTRNDKRLINSLNLSEMETDYLKGKTDSLNRYDFFYELRDSSGISVKKSEI